jgi:nanoRNase/pAp phosphatase (c-di-AMP/oligoRNAs hydrolase)
VNIKEMVEKGNAILSWVRNRNYRLVRGMGFESEYKGLRCICSNMAQGQSEFFDSLENNRDFDFMVNFFMNKKNRWNLTFYTYKNDVDVSKIAAEFGGGGHAKAAGASSLEKLPDFLLNGKPWTKPQGK